MRPIPGFRDSYGAPLRRQRHVVAVMASVAESYGFEPLDVPVVENAAAYDESVVGLSPWPEWNKNNCIYLDVPSFDSDYSEPKGSHSGVLIPEGTLSVTRWLAGQLERDPDALSSGLLPMRVFYELTCYRNELLSTLGPAKGRQFSQFGLEILGSARITGDLELLMLAAESMSELGVVGPSVSFRVSSNDLFRALAQRTGLDHHERVQAKELLDTIAECKAGKQEQRQPEAERRLARLVNSQTLDGQTTDAWNYLVSRMPGPVIAADSREVGWLVPGLLEYLHTLAGSMRSTEVGVEIDYCVVRSHEYYTGLTFEIDLLGENDRHVEVGGGGRYDHLVGSFLEGQAGLVVPSIGYAFGLERLVHAMTAEGYLRGEHDVGRRTADLSEGPALEMKVRTPGPDPTDQQLANAYLDAYAAARDQHPGRRVRIEL